MFKGLLNNRIKTQTKHCICIFIILDNPREVELMVIWLVNATLVDIANDLKQLYFILTIRVSVAPHPRQCLVFSVFFTI